MEIEEAEPTIEWELEHLQEFNNEKQLRLLRQEIAHIISHGLQVPEGWYDERFEYIYKYSQIDWLNLAKTYHNSDQYLHDTSLYIARLLDELLDDRATEPNFDLQTYFSLIHSVKCVWDYYKQVYLTEDEDDDILALINGINGL